VGFLWAGTCGDLSRRPPQSTAKASTHDHQEITVNRIRPIRRLTGLLAALAGAILACAAAPAAFATRVPPPGAPLGPAPAPNPAHTIAVGGMPGWQITLIAAAAAVLTATIAVVLDRARTRRRHLPAPGA
jgi:hypothetical protein